MQRTDIIKLENHLHILLKSYAQMKERLAQTTEQLRVLEEQLQSSRALISDLKEQLDNVTITTTTTRDIHTEIEEIQSRVLSLVNEVDSCIKAIE